MSAKHGPTGSYERVQRLLGMLPWLVANGPVVDVEAMATQFGISPSDLIADLELASTCGIPPYTPDVLAGLWIEPDEDGGGHGVIRVEGAMQFERRLDLTKEEAFGLALLGAAARNLRGFRRPADLRSALRKLRQVLGESAVTVEVGEPEHLLAVSEAARTGEKITVTYRRPSSGEVSRRTLVVRQVFSDRGHWYAGAEDGNNDWSLRTFRVDRIEMLERTGEHVETRHLAPARPRFFDSTDEGTEVNLVLPPGAGWVAETYPCRKVVENADGSFDVTLIASSEHWLGRLLLRAGAGARVTSPAAWADLQSRTAAAVLARYSPSSN